MHIHHLPHRDPLSEDVRFPSTRCITKTNPRELFLEAFSFKYKLLNVDTSR